MEWGLKNTCKFFKNRVKFVGKCKITLHFNTIHHEGNLRNRRAKPFYVFTKISKYLNFLRKL